MPIEDFKRIVESLKLAVAVADAEGTIVFANPALAQLLGRPAPRIPGAALWELFAPGDQKRMRHGVERVTQGKSGASVLEVELAEPAPAGQWVQAALQPARDARGATAGVIAVLRDIGAQRDTEEALNLVTARLLAMTDALPVATMIEAASGEVEFANGAFCRLLELGSAPQSLSGLAVADVLARSPHVDRAALERVLARPEARSKLAFALPDGRGVSLERHPIAVETGRGGAIWIAAVAGARDETAGPAPSAGGVALIEKIGEELSVSLEGLAAVSIRAQQLEVAPAIVDHLRTIRASTEAAMAAMGDVVDFSRLSGGVVLRKAPFALRAALAELVARLVQEAEEQGCRLRIKVEQDVPDSLEGDVARLQLVLKNLLGNAFSLAPGAEVALQITPEYTTHGAIQLSFAVHASRESAAKACAAAGMGVAVARFMVAAMGGALAIASRPGEALYGFTIGFPVRPAPPAPQRPTHVSLVGLTVLVVSAEPAQRLALARLLRAWRMVPLEADNAAMALALLERLDEEGAAVPLVMLSNRLPVQDGFLLAFRIRHHPRLSRTLVMMLATEGRPGDAIACRENGIAAYMRYPVNERQLNEAIVAVTGASVDSDETPTLVTRHSLREQRKGATLLLVDPSRDSQILAAHVLGRHDCSVVVAHDLAEAIAALDQDFYDIVVVDAALEGLGGADTGRQLRSHIPRDPGAVILVAATAEHSPAFHAAQIAAGFDATLAKPFRREALLALLEALARERAGAL